MRLLLWALQNTRKRRLVAAAVAGVIGTIILLPHEAQTPPRRRVVAREIIPEHILRAMERPDFFRDALQIPLRVAQHVTSHKSPPPYMIRE